MLDTVLSMAKHLDTNFQSPSPWAIVYENHILGFWNLGIIPS